MAHIIDELKFGSREGSSRGANGVNNPRTFIVKLDVPDADFTELRYPDPRGIVELYKVRYGSAHPWDGSAKATQYEIVERVSNKTWKVRVLYTVGGVPAPTMEAAWDRWNVSIRGAATTEQIIEEPAEALESWGLDPTLGKLIGTPYFAEAKDGEYTAKLWRLKADGTAESYEQHYYKTDSRKVRPYSDDVQALTYTQTRLFANFNLERVGLIARYYKRVNRFTYLGADAAFLKFVDFNLDEVSHQIGDGSIQLEPGIAYRASVVFLYSAKAFTPLSLVATVTDELGNQVPVLDSDGNKVVDDNWTVAAMDFNTLLSIISGGKVPGPNDRSRRR